MGFIRSIIIPTKGRGFINHGSGLASSLPAAMSQAWALCNLASRMLKPLSDSSVPGIYGVR